MKEPYKNRSISSSRIHSLSESSQVVAPKDQQIRHSARLNQEPITHKLTFSPQSPQNEDTEAQASRTTSKNRQKSTRGDTSSRSHRPAEVCVTFYLDY